MKELHENKIELREAQSELSTIEDKREHMEETLKVVEILESKMQYIIHLHNKINLLLREIESKNKLIKNLDKEIKELEK